MTLDQIKGNWLQMIGEAEIAWGSLTGNSHAKATGIRNQIAGRHQVDLGTSIENEMRNLKEFYDRNRNWNPSRH